MDVPIYYDYATQLQNAVTPGTLKPRDNMTTQYYIRYLLKRAMSVFEFDGIPENWDENYFRYVLWVRGYCAVIENEKVGVIPQMGVLGGFNIYYTPTFITIACAALPEISGQYWLSEVYNINQHPNIKGDACLVKLQPDYRGLLDVCTITAERLAWMHEALVMNVANSKLAYIIGAGDKGAAETFKAAIDSIQEGNLAVAAGRNLWNKDTGEPLWQGFANNLRANYIATDILENMRSELNDFNNFVGIPSTNYNKKAHMTETEVNANDVETESLCDMMFDSLKAGLDGVNKRYGLNITVKKRYGEMKEKIAVGGDDNGNVQGKSVGAV